MRMGTFAGYVGRDAETRVMPSGDLVLNFSLAVSTGTKDKPGTLWVDCGLFGKRAESLGPYILKGTPLTVCGDVDIRAFEKRDGTPGCAMTCRVDKLTFGGRSNGSEAREDAPQRAPAAAPAPAKDDVPFDDQIPF